MGGNRMGNRLFNRVRLPNENRAHPGNGGVLDLSRYFSNSRNFSAM